MKSAIRCIGLFILANLVLSPLPARAEGWDGNFGVPGMSGGYVEWPTGVWDLVEYNGGIVACGNFAEAGGVACRCVAAWNGSAWQPLGTGLNGLVNCMVVHEGDLYVGGWFTEAGGASGTVCIARWDGLAWHSVGGGVNDVVYALRVYNDELVVGGRFTQAGPTAVKGVARWDGAAWRAMGAGFSDDYPNVAAVWCFAEYAGELVAGGRFLRSGTVVVNRIALWNGSSWRALGGGVWRDNYVASVYDMTVLGGDLIVGGEFWKAGSLWTENLARWDGSQWHAVIESGFNGATANGVTAVSPYLGGLVIGGVFSGLVGVSGTAHLAYWNGLTWTGLGSGTDGNVEDVLVQGNDLLVSGAFVQAGATAANHIARWRGSAPPLWSADRSLVAWGSNEVDQCALPSPNTGFTAMSAGGEHGLGLKDDGAIVAWGFNGEGQCTVPAPNTAFTAVAAGSNFSFGLKTDGSVAAWGYNGGGACNVPLPNTGFTAVAAGGGHGLGLKTGGVIVAWGRNNHGQLFIPMPNAGFVAAVAGGGDHSLGLKASGSIVAWGYNYYGQCNVPAPNADFTAVAAGYNHSLGLKNDGSIVAWGNNDFGQCSVPSPNTGFTAVAAGDYHSLGLKADGSIVAWGLDTEGQCDVPAPNRGFMAVSGGGRYSLGLGAFALTVSDAPDDQGGQVTVSWSRHALDVPAVPTPATAYDIQRYDAGWQTVTTVAAAQAADYSVEVATPDILTLGQPAPYSRYRLVVRTIDPLVLFESLPDSGYSIDNLPPPAPVLAVEDEPLVRTVFANGPRPSDYRETCFYRGREPGFTPGDPIQCGSSRWYDEDHLIIYYYRARDIDIHGNASEWSNEVTGQYPTDVPGAAITQVRLHANQPNPFNPRTTIRFDLPAAGPVRLAVYDVAGRLVRVLAEGEVPAGSHQAVWDGRDDAGRAAPSGSYLARLVAGGKVEVVRMGLVR